MATRSRWTRRLASTLIILGVAGLVGVWSTRQNRQRDVEVEAYAWSLCDVAMGPSPPPAGYAGAFVSRTVGDRLQAVLHGADRADVTIAVEPDDPPATHRAIVSVSGRPVIGLRFAHDGSPGEIAMIGYWIP